MTRSHKANDRDHKSVEEAIPKYFGKHGPLMDPKKIKRHGHGRTNWGDPMHDVDSDEFNFTRSRRHSNNKTSRVLRDFRTKFDVNEEEPVFDELAHGPLPDAALNINTEQTTATTSTADSSPVDEELPEADGHPLAKAQTTDSSASSEF